MKRLELVKRQLDQVREVQSKLIHHLGSAFLAYHDLPTEAFRHRAVYQHDKHNFLALIKLKSLHETLSAEKIPLRRSNPIHKACICTIGHIFHHLPVSQGLEAWEHPRVFMALCENLLSSGRISLSL